MSDQQNQIDEWELQMVQTRYEAHYGLKLTIEQARLVYKWEQDKYMFSDKHFFSDWEEWDYQRTTFREILDEKQFNDYEVALNEAIRHYEQNLVEQDKVRTNDVAYHEELLQFYEARFLPDILKEPYIRLSWLSSEKAKIEYIRAEYKQFLSDTKKAILTSHFRYYRTFRPNKLKLSLLRHKLSYVLPDYEAFRRKMDEPTKGVADYLQSRLRYIPDKIEELLSNKFDELAAFHEATFKKYYGDERGWHVVIRELTPQEVKEHRAMILLLIDPEKYGSSQ